jgi:hypothetical protein
MRAIACPEGLALIGTLARSLEVELEVIPTAMLQPEAITPTPLTEQERKASESKLYRLYNLAGRLGATRSDDSSGSWNV